MEMYVKVINGLTPLKFYFKETKMTDTTFPEGSLISYPREDGMVQHKDWNAYLDSHDHPAWANRWMCLQDTLLNYAGRLTKAQILNNRYNPANARFMIASINTGSRGTLSTLGWIWQPYNETGLRNRRVAIQDAITFTADYPIPNGPNAGAISVGTWAVDVASLIPSWVAQGFWCNLNPPVLRERIYEFIGKLEEIKPVKPGNELPEGPPTEKPDNTLPEGADKPDNALPPGPITPDNTLPSTDTPDNALPSKPGHPSHQPVPKPPTGPVAKPTK